MGELYQLQAPSLPSRVRLAYSAVTSVMSYGPLLTALVSTVHVTQWITAVD